MSGDLGARGWGTDDDDMATLEQQHAGLRSTYLEHEIHVRHRAHVPITDGLIEGRGKLQRSEGRAAVWREQRSRSEEMGDDDTATLEQQQHAGWRSTYIEHLIHVRHRARVPITDVLIEGLGILPSSRQVMSRLRAVPIDEFLSLDARPPGSSASTRATVAAARRHSHRTAFGERPHSGRPS